MTTETTPDRAPVPKVTRVKDEAYRERQRVYMREYAKRKAEHIKNYRTDNADLIKELGAAYREKHREALNESRRKWGQENKDRVAEKNAEWREANPERAIATARKWSEENPEKQAASSKAWREKNAARVRWHARMRGQRLKHATPAWADFTKMDAIYLKAKQMTVETGIEHVVDHILPLKGKLVCGFHCEANLQVLTASENSSKGNKFVPE